MPRNISSKTFTPAAIWLAAGIIGGMLAPIAIATPQTEKNAPAKPAAPAFVSLHTATENASTIKATVVERSANKEGKLVDKARLLVTVGPSGVARIEQELLDAGAKSNPLLEKPTLGVFDGKDTVVYDADNHKYMRFPASNGVPVAPYFPMRPVWAAVRGVAERETVSGPEETIDGRKMLVRNMDITRPGESQPALRQRYVIDAETHLLRRMETIVWQDDKPLVITQYDFSDWKVNPTVAATYFDLLLPEESEEVKMPKPAPAPPRPETLAVGTVAPDFTCLGAGDKPVKLSDFKGKVVVLDFWATWCGPCQKSMPHLESVYNQVKDKNVAVLALCVSDLRPAYDAWLTKNKTTYTFPVAFDPAERDASKNIAVSLYKVSGIPTQYVIDKDGKVAAVFVGYNGSGDHRLEETLATLGVPLPAKEVAAAP